LASVPVPSSFEERVRALRDGLAYPKHEGGSRRDEALVDGGEGYLCTPKGYDPKKKPYPLVMSIHGRHGDRHEGIRPFALPEEEWRELRKPIEDEIVKKGHDLSKVTIKRPPLVIPWEDGIVAGPTVADPKQDEMPPARAEAMVMALLARANRTCLVDQDRVVLTGISAGAAITYLIAARHPDRFAGAFGHAGGVFGDTPLENLRPLQVLVVHGDKDKSVNVEEGRRTDRMLADAKVTHVYREIKGLEHRWVEQGSEDARYVRSWLRERVRVPWPRSVEHRFETSEKVRRVFWISVPAGDSVMVTAKVKDNEIDIESRATSMALHLAEPLVDTSKEIVVRWNGTEVHRAVLSRSWKDLLSDLETDGFDVPRAAPARLEIRHP
jgi:predicted esterase